MTHDNTSSDDDQQAPGFASFDNTDGRGHGQSEKTPAEMTHIPPTAVAPPVTTPPPADETPPQQQPDTSGGAGAQ
ncbi:hypothetical protein [Streptomyces sp. NBC_01207]|uniref:hypothetical protein n=1 Tax=Streptomyces sp. NBC_01207 TaxID=2903772 RepID=UPI002E13CC04|nr:hypothetical protein OG457_30700 [Streptomyces sp. NBC_01207]